MTLALTVGLWLFAILLLLRWLGRTWSSSRFRARTRGHLVASAVDLVVALAAVRAIAPPPGPWSWLWLPAAALTGIGLAGAVRRWSDLPWRVTEPGEPRPAGDRRAVAGAVARVVVGTSLVALLA